MEWSIIGTNFLYAALGVVLMWFSYRIIDKLTPEVDFPAELKKGNVAVAIFIAAIFLSIALIMRDTAAMLEFVDGQPLALALSLGAVGYCMGGPFVFAAAAQFPDRIKCAASIYGAGLVTDRPDSPHLTAKQIRGEMYFACAEIDKYAPRDQIDALEAHLEASDVNYRLERYPGAEHGFAFPQRAGVYHKPSAERHWARLFAMFRRNLG